MAHARTGSPFSLGRSAKLGKDFGVRGRLAAVSKVLGGLSKPFVFRIEGVVEITGLLARRGDRREGLRQMIEGFLTVMDGKAGGFAHAADFQGHPGDGLDGRVEVAFYVKKIGRDFMGGRF
jgi:hypothetical protein